LAAPDKRQFIPIPLWSSRRPRYGPSIPPMLVQSHIYIICLHP
jgi:hypothetical protein